MTIFADCKYELFQRYVTLVVCIRLKGQGKALRDQE